MSLNLVKANCLRLLLVAWLLNFGVALSADLVETQAELDAILTDQARQEDFEGLSVAGGSSVVAPNPLNSMTASPSWGIVPGATYSSPTWLRLYASSLFGDDSNVLAGGNELHVEFAQPQRAIGFYNKNITGGGFDYNITISFYRGNLLLDSFDYVLPSTGEEFRGWEDAMGITSLTVQSSNSWAIIDNIQWGISVATVPEPVAIFPVLILGGWCIKRRKYRNT